MKGKRSSFFAFIFSLLPGAGEMYLGFMKRGTSIMVVFWGLIFLSAWLNIGPLLYGMPIIWFISFFDVHNLRSMPDSEFQAKEDDFIFIPEMNMDKVRLLRTKYRTVFALALILFGFSILWNNTFNIIEFTLPSYYNLIIYRLGHYFPQLIVGLVIIAIGIYLIRGKKEELDKDEAAKNQGISLLDDKGGQNL
ncbi:hypothetical protein I5677_03610 [Mobilitalea sibirica]|uniref:TM2 domain-containing protein n=1 Tax=Mobilitalea sibirica TaxID=1462919 RepID=A0A8J7HBG8_9FIRM|nr:hypothetical protein [Mobilitalea sibirica]MBH1939982.1 hypothetical protein [Mobilitalea sibirica]